MKFLKAPTTSAAIPTNLLIANCKGPIAVATSPILTAVSAPSPLILLKLAETLSNAILARSFKDLPIALPFTVKLLVTFCHLSLNVSVSNAVLFILLVFSYKDLVSVSTSKAPLLIT